MLAFNSKMEQRSVKWKNENHETINQACSRCSPAAIKAERQSKVVAFYIVQGWILTISKDSYI
jgi:hypothetical protein